jgi:ABC-type glycerol-3-phosphate transport system substrate-binding protein
MVDRQGITALGGIEHGETSSMSDEQCVARREFLKQAGRIAGAGVALPYVFSLAGNQPALAYHRASSALPKFQGQISFYAQAYTPQHATKSNPHPPTTFFEVAARYEKMHPNIKIKFLPANLGGTNYPGWVTTEAAGGTLPDITWNQWGQVNTGYYPTGIYVNLKPYLLRPNPYVPGNRRWIDLFNPRTMQEITSPLDGGIYAVDGDYVGTAIYYVRDHVQKIGVKKLPHIWKDFMAIHEQLKRHGFTPLRRY